MGTGSEVEKAIDLLLVEQDIVPHYSGKLSPRRSTRKGGSIEGDFLKLRRR